MRLMGEKFYDDGYYLESALREGERFVSRLHVSKDSNVLEIGSASGRSIIGLIQKAGDVGRYVGIDVNENNVRWCNKYIAGRHSFCEFYHVDMWNILYNPEGKIKLDDNFRLDFDDGTFDIVYLQSVLGNTLDWEIRIFANEYFRLLKPGGILFLTAFIEENVPDMTENPENYVMECTFPQQIMRFEKAYFLKMFTDAGFQVDAYEQGTEVDSQSAVYLKKPQSLE